MTNGAPNLFLADQLRDWGVATEIDGRWVAARPLGYQGWMPLHRLRLAWGVFTGRYDALRWTEKGTPA